MLLARIAAVFLAAVTAFSLSGPAHAAEPSDTKLAAMLQTLPQAHNTEERLQPNTAMLLRLIEKLWPYYATEGPIYGWREDAIADHPSGQALDIMMKDDGRTPESVAEGNSIAGFLIANASALGIDYMMWRQHIWQGDGWRPTRNYGNWTDNHMNHIHVKVFGNHVPTGTLTAPENLPDSQMPDLESIEQAYRKRIKQLKAALAAAKIRAGDLAAQADQAGVARAAAEAAAAESQREIDELIRNTYIFGGDVQLVTATVGLLADPVTVGSAQMVAERTQRHQIERFFQSKAALEAAAGAEAQHRAAADTASAELAAARKALDDAQSPFEFATIS